MPGWYLSENYVFTSDAFRAALVCSAQLARSFFQAFWQIVWPDNSRMDALKEVSTKYANRESCCIPGQWL